MPDRPAARAALDGRAARGHLYARGMASKPREELAFDSGGDRCAAWLYRPGEGFEEPSPIVVMAHGFGGTREGRLGAYAERFAAAGIAALVFDYRSFGESEGSPRQMLSISRQHEDWRAAVAFARSLGGIDPRRVALWGTSFSGGHVVVIAAEDPAIAAVVSQAPFSHGPLTLKEAGPGAALRLTVAGIRDAVGAARGHEPHRIPIVGRPGETAAMCQPDSFDGYHALFDDDAVFRNEFSARAMLATGFYVPARKASKVRCPLLVLTVAGDRVTPPGPARKMAERAPRGRLIEYPGPAGHFDIYVGDLFERTIADQTAFLRESLGVV